MDFAVGQDGVLVAERVLGRVGRREGQDRRRPRGGDEPVEQRAFEGADRIGVRVVICVAPPAGVWYISW